MFPEVKLINVCDNRQKAWRYSRPNTDRSNDQLSQYGRMDIGVNSLCTLTFEVTSSVVFRDWLLSIRPIFCWAISSRVIRLDQLEISSEMTGIGQEALDKVKSMATDNNQDAIREGLPLSVSTSYTISMDMRTCVGMLKTMRDVDPAMWSVYGAKFWNECKNIPGFTASNVKPFTETYMPNKMDRGVEGVEKVGSMLAGRYMMKGALAAQFIRSSQAKVKSELWTYINNFGYYAAGELTQSYKFSMAFYMDSNVYDKMMQLRSHWFADWSDDMWGGLVADYTDNMTDEEFWHFTPAGEDRPDPYKEELLNRVDLTDPNLPCPIMLDHPDLIERRIELFGNNPLTTRYISLAENGFIIDNNDNHKRKTYEENLKKRK